MIEADFLDTYEYDLDHDDPLLNRLLNNAELSWYQGAFEGLKESAEWRFEMYQDAEPGEDAHLSELRRAYNALLEAKTIAEFELGAERYVSEETSALLDKREEALARELLEFYGDRETWVILEVKDTETYGSAWLLIAWWALGALGVEIKRAEA